MEQRASSPNPHPGPLLPSAIPRDVTSTAGTGSSPVRPISPSLPAAAAPLERQTPTPSIEATRPGPSYHYDSALSRETSTETFTPSGGGEASNSCPAEFTPLFTVVDDARAHTTLHPEVRYIFSDDDGDNLADMLIRLNSPSGRSAATSQTVTRRGIAASSSASSVSTGTAARRTRTASALGPPVQERAIVVTLAPDGRSVASAHSLTSDWQILAAGVTAAPTLDGNASEGGLMLRISGTEGFNDHCASDSKTVRPEQLKDGRLSMEAAVELYRERMDELRKIAAAGAVLD